MSSYCSDLRRREGEMKEVVQWFEKPDLKNVKSCRERIVELGLGNKSAEEMKKGAENEMDLLQRCRLNMLALGLTTRLDKNPERSGVMWLWAM